MSTWKELLSGDGRFAVAHRGFSAHCPENTLPAFQAAIDTGAPALELDVRLTRDRVPVVIHDDTLDRTTNGSGRVDEHDASAISKLDAGSWFGPAHGGATVPLLETVLAILADRILVNIELKPVATDEPPHADDLAVQVAHLIHKLRMEERVIVSCFDADQVEQVRAARDGIRASLLVEEVGDVREVLLGAEAMDALFVSPDADLLEEGSVRAFTEAGMPVVPYVVNDAPTMHRLLDWSVRGFFTDEVDLAQRVLEEA